MAELDFQSHNILFVTDGVSKDPRRIKISQPRDNKSGRFSSDEEKAWNVRNRKQDLKSSAGPTKAIFIGGIGPS